MVVTNMKLKIKIATKKPVTVPCEFVKQMQMTDPSDHCPCGNGEGKSELHNIKRCGAHMASDKRNLAFDSAKLKPSLLGTKRGLDTVVEVPKEKRLKMDRSMTLRCSDILRKLMKHPDAWAFKEPVDPIALNIPDYFSIISEPMDLGTIKTKLDKNIYSIVEEFESDVRLTFSNAMLYNPPSNFVHLMAKRVNAFFDSQWRLVETNTNRQSINVRQGNDMTCGERDKSDVSSSLKLPSVHVDTLPKRSTPVTGKTKPKDSKESSLEKKLSQRCKDGKAESCRAAKSTSCGLNSDGVVGCLDEKNSCPSSVRVGIVSKKTGQLAEKMRHDGTKGGSLKKVSRSKTNATMNPSDLVAENTSESHMSRCDPDFDGWEIPAYEIQLSPNKALRAAMLKSRFADTILKAQHKTLLHHGDEADILKRQQDKEKLERKQREEKARIEARINALQMQRQREREAARIELEKMEKSVDIDDNIYILRDLEMLIGDYLNCFSPIGCGSNTAWNQFEDGRVRSPLEQLGLFFKADYMEDDEEEPISQRDLEEGELLI
ncbi:hypothetical protein Nepgr_017578 [Nepenthes gracilis]|uniref:Bromo domain-containing protein n=1 Tax=Nepenthes gracilis TaxID=150966 RepID=A0AAD3SSL4_NEPGR|nr:hypothetical protein Nepgr_017578 [Nepenthes gracilis]